MKSLALAATAVLLAFANPVSAQSFDGANCDSAYKKLAQHRDSNGTCREKSGEEKGGSVTPERAARHASGLKN